MGTSIFLMERKRFSIFPGNIRGQEDVISRKQQV
jgi:hypothetical protein